MNKVVSYAQNREDVLLSGLLSNVKKGFYVDIGASHPEHFSVTKLFYDKGWSGINVEPNKHLHNLLELNRTRDINLNVGVSNKAGSLIFREYPGGDGLSTFSQKIKEDYAQNPSNITDTYKDYEVAVTTLKDIFEKQKIRDVNFMKIDVEGFEYEVIEGNDWTKFRPQILCIESLHIVRDWHPLLQANNYSKIFFDGLNEYFIADEHHRILSTFSYPETMLAKPIVTPEVNEELTKSDWQLRQVERKLIRQEIISESLRAEIYQLNMQAQFNKRIRVLIKQLLRTIDSTISLHIEKLNKPPVHKHQSLHISGTDPVVTIAEIQQYDFQRYYGLKSKPSVVYSITSFTYNTLSDISKKILIKSYSFIRTRGSHA